MCFIENLNWRPIIMAIWMIFPWLIIMALHFVLSECAFCAPEISTSHMEKAGGTPTSTEFLAGWFSSDGSLTGGRLQFSGSANFEMHAIQQLRDYFLSTVDANLPGTNFGVVGKDIVNLFIRNRYNIAAIVLPMAHTMLMGNRQSQYVNFCDLINVTPVAPSLTWSTDFIAGLVQGDGNMTFLSNNVQTSMLLRVAMSEKLCHGAVLLALSAYFSRPIKNGMLTGSRGYVFTKEHDQIIPILVSLVNNGTYNHHWVQATVLLSAHFAGVSNLNQLIALPAIFNASWGMLALENFTLYGGINKYPGGKYLPELIELTNHPAWPELRSLFIHFVGIWSGSTTPSAQEILSLSCSREALFLGQKMRTIIWGKSYQYLMN